MERDKVADVIDVFCGVCIMSAYVAGGLFTAMARAIQGETQDLDRKRWVCIQFFDAGYEESQRDVKWLPYLLLFLLCVL